MPSLNFLILIPMLRLMPFLNFVENKVTLINLHWSKVVMPHRFMIETKVLFYFSLSLSDVKSWNLCTILQSLEISFFMTLSPSFKGIFHHAYNFCYDFRLSSFGIVFSIQHFCPSVCAKKKMEYYQHSNCYHLIFYSRWKVKYAHSYKARKPLFSLHCLLNHWKYAWAQCARSFQKLP